MFLGISVSTYGLVFGLPTIISTLVSTDGRLFIVIYDYANLPSNRDTQRGRPSL